MPCYIRLAKKVGVRLSLSNPIDREEFEKELKRMLGALSHRELEAMLEYIYLRDEEELRELFEEAWENYLAKRARRKKELAYVV